MRTPIAMACQDGRGGRCGVERPQTCMPTVLFHPWMADGDQMVQEATKRCLVDWPGPSALGLGTQCQSPPKTLHRALRRMAGLVFLLVFWALAGACQRHGVGGSQIV